MFNANQYYVLQNKAPSQLPPFIPVPLPAVSPNGNILHPGANFTQVLQLVTQTPMQLLNRKCTVGNDKMIGGVSVSNGK
jgi:hypothetical protein